LPIEIRGSSIQLLIRLFPKLQNILRKIGDLEPDSDEWVWREKSRICSQQVFPVYFRFSQSDTAISRMEMHSLLSAIGDGLLFRTELKKLAGTKGVLELSRVSEFLDELLLHVESEVP